MFYTPAEFKVAVFNRFNDVWADLTGVAFPNVEFKTADRTSYARLTLTGDSGGGIRWGTSSNPQTFLQGGRIRVQCFVREGLDTDQAYIMAERALSFLRRQVVSGVIFSEVSPPQEIGEDGPWFQVAVTAQWRYFTRQAD